MARSRANTIIDESTTLGSLFQLNGAPFTPLQVRQVQILDQDGVTILETIPSGSITNVTTGLFEITMSAVSTAGVYFDKWFWTPTSAQPEQIQQNSVLVFAVEPSGTVTDDFITDVRADIDDEVGAKITDVSLKVLIDKSVKDVNRRLQLAGTANEILFENNLFTVTPGDDLWSILLLCVECKVQKRFFSGAVGKGIKVTQGRTSIDTTAAFKGHADIIGGAGGVCLEFSDAITDYKLDIAGVGDFGEGIY